MQRSLQTHQAKSVCLRIIVELGWEDCALLLSWRLFHRTEELKVSNSGQSRQE